MEMTQPDWFLNEPLYAGPEHLDPTYVATYDAKAATDPSEDIAQLLANGLNRASTLIDLGAGTGTLALAAAPHCREVVAVDVSGEMLAILQRRAASQGIRNIRVEQAGFLSYAHQGPPAEFIYSRNALHHLPDFWKVIALRRMARMLTPGGVLLLHDLVYSFEPDDAGALFEHWLSNAAANPAAGWTRAELATHIREEFSTFSWLLEPMLTHAGFEIREVAHRPIRTFSTYLCVRRADL